MSKYVSLVKVRGTVQNVQKLASIWGDLRTELEEYDADLQESYAILGEYDFLVIMDAPGRDEAFKASMAIENQGLDMQTMEIIPVEDFASLVDE
ncbi:GYD domain-containing protein [Halomicrococcus sp. NG-SE-24]|uniref:GYD domain-containing protein n=1 Tax=Halomicrococcus sp. NG-SE-24 TaxID=3436928 RepID=UPI003D97F122